MKHALRTKITGPSGAEKLTRRLRGRRPGLNGTCAIPGREELKTVPVLSFPSDDPCYRTEHHLSPT